MLQVSNISSFAHLTFSARDADDGMNDVLVAKGTYALKPSPDAASEVSLDLEAAPEASFVAVTDEYTGVMNKSSVRTESDLAPFKPRCDVIVIGSAHSPTGRPVERIVVGVDIESSTGKRELGHRLVALGPRDLVRRVGIERGATTVARYLGADAPEWYVGEPEPFLSMPLRYEFAFGGELKVASDDEAAERVKDSDRLTDEVREKHPDGAAAPIAHTVCRLNPVGCGFVEKWHARATGAARYPAPRIEAVGAPLTAEVLQAMINGRSPCGSEPALTPQGFGVIAKPWQPRLKLAGTFDEAWRTSRAPDMPKDFDMAYWNGAHPAMQCEHLYGGEMVTLTNLMPPGSPGTRQARPDASVAKFRVPAVELALRMKFEAGNVIYGLLPIDTLVVDLDSALVHIAWRLQVPGKLPLRTATLVSRAEVRNNLKARAIAAE